MAKPEPTDRVEVSVTNEASGRRFVNTVEGQVGVNPGQTINCTLTVGEAAALHGDDETPGNPDFTLDEPVEGEADAGTENEDHDKVEIPDDLADESQQDGLIKKTDLKAVADKEGAKYEGDANKATIFEAIMAKRAEAAAE